MYRLTRQIARGNATFIWEAIKLGTTDRYVVKVLDDKHRGNKEEIGYLKLEYDVAHQLDHPNIIRVFEVNLTDPTFIVLEVFSVTNLKQGIRQERERVLCEFSQIAEQCAGALGHLHGKGWVHCDIKPDNFLWNEAGVIKLIDFTIARKAATGFFGRLFGGQKVIRGTRSYMSPEQIRGQPVDQTSDIYSFGCLLYELLTGKVPYTANSPNELLTKHLTAPIPTVQVHNDNVTPEMADLLRKMMSKEPKERLKSMVDVLQALKSIRVFKFAPRPKSEEGDAAPAK